MKPKHKACPWANPTQRPGPTLWPEPPGPVFGPTLDPTVTQVEGMEVRNVESVRLEIGEEKVHVVGAPSCAQLIS